MSNVRQHEYAFVAWRGSHPLLRSRQDVSSAPSSSRSALKRMSSFRPVTAIVLLCLARVACAGDCGKPISVDAVARLSSPVTLGDLKTKFGDWCQGHGPVSWYRSTRGKEIWFWWQLPSQPATTEAEGLKYRVLVATEVPVNDESIQVVIWPKAFVGSEMADIYPGYRR
jgi:hypothetical protein